MTAPREQEMDPRPDDMAAEEAPTSDDKDLIGDALYNLVQYHLDGDLDQAAYQLDDAIEYLEDDEWVDLLPEECRERPH